ncbi:MAG: hypothetical protein M1825_001956 [Sarcosagium campestre]|nr:MAG: hypothetical protein M1825_001956 [Sarcosagium campestre]
MAFNTIPIIDLSLADSPDSKPALLEQLRYAVVQVGFLYIENTGVPAELAASVVEQAEAFFDLPMEEKLRIEMKNGTSLPFPSFPPYDSPSYSRLGNEITKSQTDWREQLDLSTPHPLPSASAPRYHNLLAPNQWPSAALLPDFQPTLLAYLTALREVSQRFTSLLAESLGLAPTAFARFFDADQQHKLKLVLYPPTSSADPTIPARQGVGPHKDSMLTSYLLQASPQHTTDALQVQSVAAAGGGGRWIDVPPREGSLVVAIGQGLEALTDGVCRATTHRVLSPRPGNGPRLSVPFFQGVSYDATFEAMGVPEEVKALKRSVRAAEVERGGGAVKDEADFQFVKGRWGHLGEATLANRIRSHPDVGERWYPDILAQIRAEQEQEQEQEQHQQKETSGVEGVEQVKQSPGDQTEIGKYHDSAKSSSSGIIKHSEQVSGLLQGDVSRRQAGSEVEAH